MEKEIRCPCGYVILAAAGKHAQDDHGMEVTSELVEKVKSAISDE